MTDLRDKIAQYLDEKFPEYDAASTYEAADAIMELLGGQAMEKQRASVVAYMNEPQDRERTYSND